MILPFGAGVTQNPEAGHADGAPTKTYLGIKILITSIISIILTAGMAYIIEHGILKNLV